MQKNKQFRFLKEYAIITFGLFLSALGWSAFIIPSKITGGGVNGIATLLYFATGIKVAAPVFLVNLVLILAAWRVMGTRFALKTFYGVSVLSLFFWVLQTYISEPFVKEQFMAAVVGGAMSGIGLGIIFAQGGSSGGVTIVAMMINKHHNHSPGKVMMAIDVLVIGSSWFIFQSIEVIVYGLVTMSITSYASDIILSGNRQSFNLFILSSRYEEIADKISEEVGRGITVWQGTGWHSNREQQVMMVMVRKYEVGSILRIIKEVDSKAYVTQSEAAGLYGPGFDSIKK